MATTWKVHSIQIDEGPTKYDSREITVEVHGVSDCVISPRSIRDEFELKLNDDSMAKYLKLEEETMKHIQRNIVNSRYGLSSAKSMKITDVIFNPPATIVFWADGTKTVVQAQGMEEFDPEKGLAMAISKKALGNKGNYCNELKKWLAPYYYKQMENSGELDPLYPALPKISFPDGATLASIIRDHIEKAKNWGASE